MKSGECPTPSALSLSHKECTHVKGMKKRSNYFGKETRSSQLTRKPHLDEFEFFVPFGSEGVIEDGGLVGAAGKGEDGIRVREAIGVCGRQILGTLQVDQHCPLQCNPQPDTSAIITTGWSTKQMHGTFHGDYSEHPCMHGRRGDQGMTGNSQVL